MCFTSLQADKEPAEEVGTCVGGKCRVEASNDRREGIDKVREGRLDLQC